MITKDDQRRIKEDACIAHDALESLMYADDLCEDYIAEKARTVRACMGFIEMFAKERKE